jgi:hypothetical protein
LVKQRIKMKIRLLLILTLLILSLTMLVYAVKPQTSPQTKLLPTRGLWVQFEDPNSQAGWYPGQVIQNWESSTPDVDAQTNEMIAMGVNTLTIEIRSSDPYTSPEGPPQCGVNPVLGLYWPQPPDYQLDRLSQFFDFIGNKGLKIILVLVNMHMEEQPPTNSEMWLGSIINTIKDKPALNSIVFNGDIHGTDTDGDGIIDYCGIQAEPQLWIGPSHPDSVYVKWAVSYAMSLGVPSNKLSSGAIVGYWPADTEQNNLWAPVHTMKQIFDELGIPDNQRLYTLSFYEQNKCLGVDEESQCVDESPPLWAYETLQRVYSIIGQNSGARVVAYEMGSGQPDVWTTAHAIKNLMDLMAYFNMEGGSFWHWVNNSDDEDLDTELAVPIKLRCQPDYCPEDRYTTSKTLVECYYTGVCKPRLVLPRPRPTPKARPTPGPHP